MCRNELPAPLVARAWTPQETHITNQNIAEPSQLGFDSFELRSELLQAISDADFKEPRPIQAQTLPPALDGRDVLGLAQTGTGKTAAFVLPILQRLLDHKGSGPRALVVTPTRELASQVHADFERLAKHTRLTATCIFGGVPAPRQIRAMRRNPDIIVACPGRLLDLMGSGAVKLKGIEVLVLDEADHMFDMGFLPDLRRILRALPARRQNLLFSATMPPAIRKLAGSVLHKPAVVELANSRPADTIEHALCMVQEREKRGALEDLLNGSDFRSAIVFLRTKRRAKQLAQELGKRKHSAVALQGNMSQSQRERALRGFKDGKHQVLVATDIAARGLDIAGVSHVVNFDVPNTPDAYTHRIGRTGRSEQTGKAFTFVTTNDSSALRAIERRLGSKIPRVHVDGLGAGESRSSESLRSSSRRAKSGEGRREQDDRRREPRRKQESRRKNEPQRQGRPVAPRVSPPKAVAPRREPVAAQASCASTSAFGLGVFESKPAS